MRRIGFLRRERDFSSKKKEKKVDDSLESRFFGEISSISMYDRILLVRYRFIYLSVLVRHRILDAQTRNRIVLYMAFVDDF